MDSLYSYTTSSSSSTSSKQKSLPSFQSYLHSVRKPPFKPMKKHIAPLPPTPPKIYNVDPMNFKSVVQQLTGVPEFQPRRLQDVAPPPLNLTTPALSVEAEPLALFPSGDETPTSDTFKGLVSLEGKQAKLSDGFNGLSPLGFGLSPSTLSWCSFALMSPGSLSAWGQSPVL